MKRLMMIFAICALSPLCAQAAPSAQAVSLKVSKGYILPAYEDLAGRALEQAALWHKTCEQAPLRAAYQKTADAWAHVQQITFGPISLLLRRDRLYHWPERRNATSKGLNNLLAMKDKKQLAPERFASASVAVQGLPALERVLYANLLDDPMGCDVGRAIADNIADIVQGNLKDWRETISYLEEGKAHPIYFDNMEEVANRLFTELLAGFQMIADQKIALPMGSRAKKAKGKRAEAWRSQRSVRYIQENASGLQAMAKPFLSFLPQDAADEVSTRLREYVEAAKKLPHPLKDAVKTQEGREKLSHFIEINRSTRNVLVEQFTRHLGLTVGFNSLDGD